jgi:DNA-directed RNA polymerase subunit RPC12/RpoP
MGTSKLRRYCPEDDRMVLAEKQTPNHVLHLLLAIVSVGFWIPVWVLISLSSELSAYRCPECGGKTRYKPPRGWKRRQRRDDYEDEEG